MTRPAPAAPSDENRAAPLRGWLDWARRNPGDVAINPAEPRRLADGPQLRATLERIKAEV